MGLARNAEYWNKKYKELGEMYGPFPSQAAYDTIRFILDERKKGRELRRIAALGDGYGRNARYFAFMGLRPTIVDISEEALKLSNATEENLEGRIEIEQADLLDWHPQEQYDIAFSNFVLHLFSKEERARIYANIRQALIFGGYLCASLLSTNDDDYVRYSRTMFLGDERTLMVRGIPQHFFLREEIAEELSDAGFYVLDSTENKDPETIITMQRNTTYYFVIAKSRGNHNGN